MRAMAWMFLDTMREYHLHKASLTQSLTRHANAEDLHYNMIDTASDIGWTDLSPPEKHRLIVKTRRILEDILQSSFPLTHS